MKKCFVNLFLCLLGIVLALCAGEAILHVLQLPKFYKAHSEPIRFILLKSQRGEVIHTNYPSKKINFIYDGNPRGYFNAENVVEHSINSQGFRGKEFSLKKEKNTIRMAFLGDSFTLGEGVHFSDIYSQQTAKILSSKHEKQQRSFESLNFGVGGYNLKDSLDMFRNFVLKYNPDILVLGLGINDVERPLFYEGNKEGLILRHVREKKTQEGIGMAPAPKTFPYQFRLSQLIWHILDQKKRSEKTIQYYSSLYSKENQSLENNLDALKELLQLCRKRDVPCFILFFPLLHSLNDNHPFLYIHSRWRYEALQHQGNFVDLFPRLKGKRAQDLWVHPTDHHPNEIVHGIAADVLVEEMLSNSKVLELINLQVLR